MIRSNDHKKLACRKVEKFTTIPSITNLYSLIFLFIVILSVLVFKSSFPNSQGHYVTSPLYATNLIPVFTSSGEPLYFAEVFIDIPEKPNLSLKSAFLRFRPYGAETDSWCKVYFSNHRQLDPMIEDDLSEFNSEGWNNSVIYGTSNNLGDFLGDFKCPNQSSPSVPLSHTTALIKKDILDNITAMTDHGNKITYSIVFQNLLPPNTTLTHFIQIFDIQIQLFYL